MLLFLQRTFSLCLASLFIHIVPGFGQTDPTLPIGTIEQIAAEIKPVINKNAKIVIIAEGLEWCEGPLWIKDKKMLLFSDIPRNCIYQWTAKRGKEVYLTRSGYTGLQPRKGSLNKG